MLYLGALKNSIATSLQKAWEDEWRFGKTGTHTRKFFPTPPDASCLMNSYINHELTQILTGHCSLNRHLHKIKKVPSPICQCGQEEETVHQFLFNCSIFCEQRIPFQEECRKASTGFPPQLDAIPKTKELWEALKCFIQESKRQTPWNRTTPIVPSNRNYFIFTSSSTFCATLTISWLYL